MWYRSKENKIFNLNKFHIIHVMQNPKDKWCIVAKEYFCQMDTCDFFQTYTDITIIDTFETESEAIQKCVQISKDLGAI